MVPKSRHIMFFAGPCLAVNCKRSSTNLVLYPGWFYLVEDLTSGSVDVVVCQQDLQGLLQMKSLLLGVMAWPVAS